MKTYPDFSHVKRVLVVKLRHHGDVLLSGPVFSALKNAIPGASIDAYLYKETLPMLDGHPAIDDFLLIDRDWKKLPLIQRLMKERAILREVRNRKYDLVINLTEGDRGAIVCRTSKAKIRVGVDPEGSGMWGKKRCYTHTAKPCPHPRHSVEKNLDVLRCIGIFPNQNERELYFQIPENVEEKMRMLLDLEGIAPGEFVLMHPVSRWMFKCPPPSTFAEIIYRLHREGKRVVLSASPDPEEMKMIQRILQLVPDVPVHNFGGKISLKELGALINLSALLVTVDSVPLHLSSSLKKIALAIFGPTSDINWAPWQNPRARVVTNNVSCRPCYMPGCGGSGISDCLEQLSPSAIWNALEPMLHSSEKSII